MYLSGGMRRDDDTVWVTTKRYDVDPGTMDAAGLGALYATPAPDVLGKWHLY